MLEELERDALTERVTIALNGCLASMSNMLAQRLVFSIEAPRLLIIAFIERSLGPDKA